MNKYSFLFFIIVCLSIVYVLSFKESMKKSIVFDNTRIKENIDTITRSMKTNLDIIYNNLISIENTL